MIVVGNRNELVDAAKQVGILIPGDIENSDWDLYPHFELLVSATLFEPVPSKEALIDNARLVASLSIDEANSISKNQLIKKGFIVGRFYG